MQKIISFLKKHCYKIIFIALALIFLPGSLTMPAQFNTRTIALSMGIDSEENELKVSLQIITPQNSISNGKIIQVVSEQGKTLMEALNNLNIKLGSELGFAHTSVIIFNEEIARKDIFNLLDYMYRNTKINFNAVLAVTDKSAEEILNQSAEINNTTSGSLQSNFGFNYEYFGTNRISTLGTFFNDYYSPSKTGFLPYIKSPEKSDKNNGGSGGSGGESSGGSSGESGSAGQSSSEQSSGSSSDSEYLINNNGNTAIFKNGKLVKIISKEETRGFDWLDNSSTNGILTVDHVYDDKFYQDASVTLQVEKCTCKTKPIYRNNELILKCNIELYGFVSEIVEKSRDIKIMESYVVYLTEALKEKCKETINNDIQNALKLCKENNLDAFQFYNIFYKHDLNNLKKVLRTYGEDYLKACKIEPNIEIYLYR